MKRRGEEESTRSKQVLEKELLLTYQEAVAAASYGARERRGIQVDRACPMSTQALRLQYICR